MEKKKSSHEPCGRGGDGAGFQAGSGGLVLCRVGVGGFTAIMAGGLVAGP